MFAILLNARVIITSYNQHRRLLSPEPWSVATTKLTQAQGADIVMKSSDSSTKKNNFRVGDDTPES
jgi:hypothetical protein